tara:strand:+ start:172 stop:456 length:285 start_codon:yes stop_codon:yes gene_type:complete
MNYKVTYAIDSLDTKPVIKTFESEYEAEEWLHNEVQERMDYIVQHSQYTISEKEYQEIEEYEYSLVRLEKVESKKVEVINDDLFGETITGYSIS